MQDSECRREGAGVPPIATGASKKDEDWDLRREVRVGKHEHLGDALLGFGAASGRPRSARKIRTENTPRTAPSGLRFEGGAFNPEEARTRAMGAL